MDGFHLADAELARLGLSRRKGAPATFDAAGYVAMLRRLRENTDEIVYVPGFERDLEQPISGAIPVPRSARVIVTEGNYLLLDGAWSGVRPLLDEVWFVQVDEPTRLARLLARHVRFGKSPEFARAWIESNDQLNAAEIEATMHRADLVVREL
jgi:pantothenate kinase